MLHRGHEALRTFGGATDNAAGVISKTPSIQLRERALVEGLNVQDLRHDRMMLPWPFADNPPDETSRGTGRARARDGSVRSENYA